MRRGGGNTAAPIVLRPPQNEPPGLRLAVFAFPIRRKPGALQGKTNLTSVRGQ